MKTKNERILKNGASAGYVYYEKDKKWKWRIINGPQKKKRGGYKWIPDDFVKYFNNIDITNINYHMFDNIIKHNIGEKIYDNVVELFKGTRMASIGTNFKGVLENNSSIKKVFIKCIFPILLILSELIDLCNRIEQKKSTIFREIDTVCILSPGDSPYKLVKVVELLVQILYDHSDIFSNSSLKLMFKYLPISGLRNYPTGKYDHVNKHFKKFDVDTNNNNNVFYFIVDYSSTGSTRGIIDEILFSHKTKINGRKRYREWFLNSRMIHIYFPEYNFIIQPDVVASNTRCISYYRLKRHLNKSNEIEHVRDNKFCIVIIFILYYLCTNIDNLMKILEKPDVNYHIRSKTLKRKTSSQKRNNHMENMSEGTSKKLNKVKIIAKILIDSIIKIKEIELNLVNID